MCVCACSLQRVEVVCSGAGDDARLAALVASQNKVSRSQQLGVGQQLLSFGIATGVTNTLVREDDETTTKLIHHFLQKTKTISCFEN